MTTFFLLGIVLGILGMIASGLKRSSLGMDIFCCVGIISVLGYVLCLIGGGNIVNEIIERVLYSTYDPEVGMDLFPAMTTMLYKVCDNNTEKFDEACRLIGLFIENAYYRGVEDGKSA